MRWYFEQARTHPSPSRWQDLDEPFFEALFAFASPRFKALYRLWKQEGERAPVDLESHALYDAEKVGSGRVETLELGHRYGHLSPLTLREQEQAGLGRLSDVGLSVVGIDPNRPREVAGAPPSSRIMNYRPIDNPNAAMLSVECLVGLQLKDIDASAAPRCSIFRFDGACMLSIEGMWRVIQGGRITITNGDHQQVFGLSEPFDARVRALDALARAKVARANYHKVTGDLHVEFENDAVLESIVNSAGYESWMLSRSDGTTLVATGGGRVVAYARE